MSEIVVPFRKQEDEETEKKELVVNYTPTEEDEECFFLIYHMNVQPSEAYNMDPERRRWLMARFMMQKNMEREAFVQQRMLQQLGPGLQNLKV